MIPEAGWVTGLVVAFSAGAVVGVAGAYSVLSRRFQRRVNSILRIAKAREERVVGVLKTGRGMAPGPVLQGPYSNN
jgi:hypothetical protein